MAHKLSCLGEKPTSAIDPLLIAFGLAKQHLGDVHLGEAQRTPTFDQSYDIVGNCHGASLPDCRPVREP